MFQTQGCAERDDAAGRGGHYPVRDNRVISCAADVAQDRSQLGSPFRQGRDNTREEGGKEKKTARPQTTDSSSTRRPSNCSRRRRLPAPPAMLSLFTLSAYFLPPFLNASAHACAPPRAPQPAAIILTLPTELILEIGEMLDTMSLINLAKAHALFAAVLDDPDASLIQTNSRRCLRFHPIPHQPLTPEERPAFRAHHHAAPSRFAHLDSLLAPRKLCLHELNLLNYLVDAGLARSLADAKLRFASAIKSLTRYTYVYRRYRLKPWLIYGFADDLSFGTAGTFREVETELHLKHTDGALERIAAVYSHVAEIVKMVDYTAWKTQTETGTVTGPLRLRLPRSCCEEGLTWRQIMTEIESEPGYKEPVAFCKN